MIRVIWPGSSVESGDGRLQTNTRGKASKSIVYIFHTPLGVIVMFHPLSLREWFPNYFSSCKTLPRTVKDWDLGSTTFLATWYLLYLHLPSCDAPRLQVPGSKRIRNWDHFNQTVYLLAAKTYQIKTTVLFLLLKNVSSTAGWQDLNPQMKNRWCRGVSAMFFPSWPGKIRSLDKYVEFCPVARLGVPDISFKGSFQCPRPCRRPTRAPEPVLRVAAEPPGRVEVWEMVCVCQGLGVCHKCVGLLTPQMR